MQDVLSVNGCIAVGQTVGETDGHPTVITRQRDVGQTDKQTDRHPTVIIRACGGGRIGSERLHNSGTDRQTD